MCCAEEVAIGVGNQAGIRMRAIGPIEAGQRSQRLGRGSQRPHDPHKGGAHHPYKAAYAAREFHPFHVHSFLSGPALRCEMSSYLGKQRNPGKSAIPPRVPLKKRR
jgi:hypothetical protein